MAELSKLQVRAKVLSVISQIKSTKDYNADLLKQLYSELEEINDKKLILDILLKEYLKMDEQEAIFSGCLVNELIDKDSIEEKCFEYLKSSLYSDEMKIKIVHLLRIVGAKFDYETAPDYFDNVSDVIDADTQKMLEKAAFNPEAMLDFLDFVTAVPSNDRNLLLKSLEQDYKGDALANIVYPILYSDFDDKFKLNAIELLTGAKSSLAIAPFNYLIKTSSNDEIVSACTLGLKKLKLSGAAEDKAEEYYKNIIKDTSPAEFYATITDGNGNQAIIISRTDKETQNYYTMSAVVINDLSGVVDCFGFYNISENELKKIVNRFYESEGKYKVSPEYVKMRISEAVELSIKNRNTFPYEFICWNPLISDIEPLDKNLLTDSLSGNLKLYKNDVLTILTKEYSFRWYIKPSENKVLETMLKEIYSKENIDIEYVNNLIKGNEFNIFDKDTMNLWRERIVQCIYLLKENEKREDAEIFFSMINNDDNMHTFRMVILQRSVFNYFYSVRETDTESKFTTNIFRKKQIQKEKFDVKKAEKIVDLLAKSWIHD